MCASQFLEKHSFVSKSREFLQQDQAAVILKLISEASVIQIKLLRRIKSSEISFSLLFLANDFIFVTTLMATASSIFCLLLVLVSASCTVPDLPAKYQPSKPDTFASTFYANNTQELEDALSQVHASPYWHDNFQFVYG